MKNSLGKLWLSFNIFSYRKYQVIVINWFTSQVHLQLCFHIFVWMLNTFYHILDQFFFWWWSVWFCTISFCLAKYPLLNWMVIKYWFWLCWSFLFAFVLIFVFLFICLFIYLAYRPHCHQTFIHRICSYAESWIFKVKIFDSFQSLFFITLPKYFQHLFCENLLMTKFWHSQKV